MNTTKNNLSKKTNELVLKVNNLKKSFGETEVLKEVSLEAKQGDVFVIIGSSGSGKSTFLRCLNFLELPDSGEISLWSEEIRLHQKKGEKLEISNSRLRYLRGKIGMVFQSFNLWSHMTVLENLIQAPVHVHGKTKKEAKYIARRYLEKVGIPDKEKSYPSELSGGQQQRAAIARALCIEPEVLLFDEPTSALDPELVGEVLRVIKILAEEGRTMLITTHEMAFARDVSNWTMFFDQGIVTEEGPPNQLFTHPKTERLQRFLQK